MTKGQPANERVGLDSKSWRRHAEGGDRGNRLSKPHVHSKSGIGVRGLSFGASSMTKGMQGAIERLAKAQDLASALEAVNTLEKDFHCTWRAVGDREGNYGNINIGSDPGHGLVERVTNAIDGVIEREASRRLQKKSKTVTPASPREAVEAWFGVPGGRVAKLDARPRKGKPIQGPSRQELANNVVVRLLEGSARKQPTLEVRDLGIGLTASQVPRTILSLNEQNKIDKPYLAGAFGQGGSTALAFSPSGCLIATRRQPDLLPGNEADRVAVTFVRFNELDPETNKNGRYEYLVLANNEVPSVPAKRLPDFEAGTRVVHFNMELPQYSQRMTQPTGSLWWLLQNSLYDPVLPIWAEERRKDVLASKKDKEAGTAGKESDRRTIAGNYTRLMDGTRPDEDGRPQPVEHHDSAEIDFSASGQIRVNYWVLRQTEGNAIAAYVDEHRPITFTFNGQSHGSEDRRFISDRLSYPYLNKSLIIQVELDGITSNARRQVLSSTRDRLKQSALFQEIKEKIARTLSEDEELDRLNRERKEQLLSKHSDADRQKMQERFARLMERFRAGLDAKAGAKDSGEKGRPESASGNREPLEKLKTRDEPTFISIANTQRPVPIRIDRQNLIRLESDAPDGYLTSHVHARLAVECDPGGLIALESRSDFRGGRARLIVRASDNAKAGKTATLIVFLLPAKGKSLSSKVTIRFEAPDEDDTSGKGEKSKLHVPAPVEVYRQQWPDHNWDETAVAKVDDDGRDTIVFVNMDNRHFERFLRGASYQEVGIVRMKNNFLLYVAYYAWMQHIADASDKSGWSGEAFDRYQDDEMDRVAQTVIHAISASSRTDDEGAD